MENFNSDVAERIAKELNKRKIRQVELLALCKRVGMPISQSDMSRIFSGKKIPNLYQCAAVCRALNISMDFLVWGEDWYREDFCDTHNSETLHGTGRELKWYLGEYNFYYLSTAPSEDKIIKGRLTIEQEKEFCTARMIINIDMKNGRGEWICKEYSGRVLVSSSLGVAYLILKSDKIGEICMLCFRHRNYTIKGMECRIALALTTSAGEAKEPTMHRALLLREGLSDEQAEGLRSWLKLLGDNIQIEKELLHRILMKAGEMYPAYMEQLERIEKFTVSKEIVELSVEVLRRQLSMDRNEFADFLTLLYENAEISGNYKISSAEDIRLYEKVEAIRNSERIYIEDG